MPSPKKEDRKPKKRLGRGLSSLMSEPVKVSVEEVLPEMESPSSGLIDSPARIAQSGSGAQSRTTRSSCASETVDDAGDDLRIRFLRLDDISPNPNQPRKHLMPENLQELAASIRATGVMQPILVRSVGGGFEIVAGERRWMGARLAGLDSIPAIVRNLDTRESAEWGLVENIQREDLNPIEKAEAFQALIESFDLTQTQVAERVGIDRTSVANLVRLNQLDSQTKEHIRRERLSQGHAKVLLSIGDAEARRKLAEAAVLGKWSVRELEQRVNQLLRDEAAGVRSRVGGGVGGDGGGRRSSGGAKPEHVRALESELSTFLGMKAEIRLGRTRSSGKLIITFKNIHEFESMVKNLCDTRV